MARLSARAAEALAELGADQMPWTPKLIRVGIDGVEHYRDRRPRTGLADWPFDTPQFLILNIARGP